MTHASLFSGFGGFDLTAEWVGWTNLFNCEIDPFCRRLLAYHFPHAKQYEDIRTTDFTVWQDRVDVLTGGFPCQPFSVAGKRKGTDDDRHLWPEMLRAIREIRPHWVVGENVLGIVSWSNGMVFEQVHADLEAQGYEVESYVLPACGVGAPHRRYRTWFVAHRTDPGTEGLRERAKQADRIGVAADTYGDRCGKRTGEQEPIGKRDGASDAGVDGAPWAADYAERVGRGQWRDFPTQSPVCCGIDGLSDRLDGITFPAWRRASIRGFGNAIVPQVFLQIAETINEYETGNRICRTGTGR